jgi:hypothetical protein
MPTHHLGRRCQVLLQEVELVHHSRPAELWGGALPFDCFDHGSSVRCVASALGCGVIA